MVDGGMTGFSTLFVIPYQYPKKGKSHEAG
jgi:hypothetical protein